MLDLQQIHTSLFDSSRVAQKVLATVISYYPGRGADGTDEALCDAGGIAMSKDTGPIKGYGWVNGGSWSLKSISQEHGTLAQTSGNDSSSIKIGDKVEIIGQHACMIAAGHPWYYIVDSSTVKDADRVVDVWVPCKGW
jgi:D-serine deaminase-like pyridoxal phosphate-dependent protein